MQVIWFKKDLRTEDHRPLFEASKHGSCVCLYIYESELIQSAEYDTSHHDFINESLAELDQSLRELGSHLVLRVGEVTQVLGELHERHPIETLWSHEETGNGITYARDQRVKAWAKANQVQWKEYAQTGVVRRLKNRDGWSRARNQMMSKKIIAVPGSIQAVTGLERGRLYDRHEFGLPKNEKSRLIAGGEKTAHELLDSFLRNRGQHYSREMSSPVTAHDACSRLSASITWGCISVRQIVSALRQRQEDVRQAKKDGMPTGGWLSSLKSFDARLSWHCHFMQKLEDEPTIEFENMSRSYDGLRESDFSQERFEAWCDGQTGYPMIDACMRALRQHSWINFRMRAMLVSFSSYHLWLHWRQPAIHLAKHFLDFEPGIHFSQVQMQSGTTGINTVRIYSPIKQVKDQDPRGEFIKQYVPELAGVPDKHLPEPHKMSRDQQNQSGCWIGRDYPEPIVDHLTAYRAAKERIYAVRKQASTREEARRVVKKHGSRKGPTQPSRRTRQNAS